jgi:hypothetical protein
VPRARPSCRSTTRSRTPGTDQAGFHLRSQQAARGRGCRVGEAVPDPAEDLNGDPTSICGPRTSTCRAPTCTSSPTNSSTTPCSTACATSWSTTRTPTTCRTWPPRRLRRSAVHEDVQGRRRCGGLRHVCRRRHQVRPRPHPQPARRSRRLQGGALQPDAGHRGRSDQGSGIVQLWEQKATSGGSNWDFVARPR